MGISWSRGGILGGVSGNQRPTCPIEELRNVDRNFSSLALAPHLASRGTLCRALSRSAGATKRYRGDEQRRPSHRTSEALGKRVVVRRDRVCVRQYCPGLEPGKIDREYCHLPHRVEQRPQAEWKD